MGGGGWGAGREPRQDGDADNADNAGSRSNAEWPTVAPLVSLALPVAQRYLEKYEPPTGNLLQVTGDVMGELVGIALQVRSRNDAPSHKDIASFRHEAVTTPRARAPQLSGLPKFTGRDAPTVIT